MRRDEKEWLHELFLPAVAWRVQNIDLSHSRKESISQFKRRFFIKQTIIRHWTTPSNAQPMNFHVFYAMYYDSSISNYYHAKLNAFSIVPSDGSYVADVSFQMSIASSKHAAFAYKFTKLQTKDGFCCIADIDLPDGAVQQMKADIEQRNAYEKLYMQYVNILGPGETLEEVLVERDLASV